MHPDDTLLDRLDRERTDRPNRSTQAVVSVGAPTVVILAVELVGLDPFEKEEP